MLCENCKKEIATTHIKTVVNGCVYEKHLCSNCYESLNMSDNEMSLSDIFLSLLDNPTQSKTNSIVRCSECQSSFEDIIKTGKAGCSKCYETFYDDLLPYIKRLHGNTKHIGKKLLEVKVDTKHTSNIDELKAELKDLIEQENFEEAAIVRDRIKEIERGE